MEMLEILPELLKFLCFGCNFHIVVIFYRCIERGKMARNNDGNTTSGDYKRIIAAMVVVIIIAVISVFLSHSVFPVVQIKGDSLEPEWHSGDILLLFDKNEYQTGDLCSISLGNKILVRRVIGCSGDVVVINSDGQVFVNGTPLEESYVSEKQPQNEVLTYEVPEGCVFVLNDNRGAGYDSRDSDIGCISDDFIIGKVITKVWPLV